MNAQTTVLTLQAGQSARFPVIDPKAGDWFYITVFDTASNIEIMKVTGTAGDQFTVVRGVDNTTAHSWGVAGVRVQLNLCVAAWNDIATQLATVPPQTRFFANPITLAGAPTAPLHAVTRKYGFDTRLTKATPIMAPIGYLPIKQLGSNKVYFGWSSGENYLQIDSTFMGNVWRDTTFNPDTLANVGAQCPWASGVYQTGYADAYNGGTFLDTGSPWVLEGYTAGQQVNGDVYAMALRLVYLRNQ